MTHTLAARRQVRRRGWSVLVCTNLSCPGYAHRWPWGWDEAHAERDCPSCGKTGRMTQLKAA